MITATNIGNYNNTKRYLKTLKKKDLLSNLNLYGQKGVKALSAATPSESGKTASSWYYTIDRKRDSITIEWRNSNVNDGIPIAVLIQYGHGINGGGFVKGVDFINPTMKKVFDEIANNIWKEVISG